MRILGIETSCDETGTAVIKGKKNDKKVNLLSNVVTSSLILHSKTGGIIPEIAAREQVKYIIPVIDRALKDSNLYPSSSRRRQSDYGASAIKNYHLSPTIYRPNIDAIAVTVGPGLIGSLLVGIETARTLAYVWKKPIIPVNHLVGHIYANWIISSQCHPEFISGSRSQQKEIPKQVRNDKSISLPALALIASGGHTDLVLLKKHGSIKWLGGTRDDAAGEALDKIGRLLGLPYPGGPSIERAAKNGNPKAFNFPRPMIDSSDFDFSFSGLKTAAYRKIKSIKHLNSETSSNISASVQRAVIDVLVTKTLKAAQKYKVKSILLGGGVAANQKLRNEFHLKIENLKLKISLSVPPKYLCTDNGAMIATAAFFNYKPIPWHKLTANPELYFEQKGA